MSEYSNEQLHEAYSVEHYAHKQTQEMLQQEIRSHAFTRRALLEIQDKKFSTEEIIEIDDSWLPFIFEKMRQYGEEYNDVDFEAYEALEHYNIGGFYKGELVAFGCILEYNSKRAMCYSWNNGTLRGKKVYAKGIDYITTKFTDIVFEEFGSRLNKIKRIR